MTTTIIVGAGLFGSVLARVIRDTGNVAVLVDSRESNRGSSPAACLLKPSWLPGTLRTTYKELDDLYGLTPVAVKTQMGVNMVLEHVAPETVLLEPDIVGKVVRIRPASLCPMTMPQVWLEGVEEPIVGDRVVVCAGIWTNALLGLSGARMLQGKYGVSMLTEKPIRDPRFHIWAPYKQTIAFNKVRPDRVTQGWVGDGTAILTKNWMPRRYEDRLIQHAAEIGVIPPTGSFRLVSGIRPVGKIDKHCMVEYDSGVLINSGGGKIGLALAMHAANLYRKRYL